MKGYISVTDYDTRSSICINTSTIASITDYDDCTRIKITCGEYYIVRETVSEVCQMVESAIDSGSTESVSVETTSNGWINVEDRLPDGLDSVQIAYKIHQNGWVYRGCIAYRKCGNWYLSYDGDILITATVLAWKPLPDSDPIEDLWGCEE